MTPEELALALDRVRALAAPTYRRSVPQVEALLALEPLLVRAKKGLASATPDATLLEELEQVLLAALALPSQIDLDLIQAETQRRLAPW